MQTLVPFCWKKEKPKLVYISLFIYNWLVEHLAVVCVWTLEPKYFAAVYIFNSMQAYAAIFTGFSIFAGENNKVFRKSLLSSKHFPVCSRFSTLFGIGVYGLTAYLIQKCIWIILMNHNAKQVIHHILHGDINNPDAFLTERLLWFFFLTLERHWSHCGPHCTVVCTQ